MGFDIVPDIHGQQKKLRPLLSKLGYERRHSYWRQRDSNRQLVFLGDFIDRGEENAAVLRDVRELMEAGMAQAVLGNHELNAIHFHTIDPETGRPLRDHSEKNLRQHAAFLKEHPHGSAAASEAVAWMRTLPLWLDVGPFRVVHACWSDGAIGRLSKLAPGGILNEQQFLDAGKDGHPISHDVEILTKGPEVKLPNGHSFRDKNGEERFEMRVAWWRHNAKSWREAAVSVPNPRDLPYDDLPLTTKEHLYPTSAKPVFFGHYWLNGKPLIEAENTCCLDCSAGTDGPLVAYRFNQGHKKLSLSNVIQAQDFEETRV